MPFDNFRQWRPGGIPFGLSISGADPDGPSFLGDLSVGERLLYRSKTDWRWAAVARRTDKIAVLTVCSPKGGTYRIRRSLWVKICFEGDVPLLKSDRSENWRGNLADYDNRW